MRVCHPNADSYRNMEPQMVYRIHENEKSVSILEEYLMWNGEHSPHWFLRQRVGWGNNALGSLSIGRAHCLKERRAIFLSHLLGKSPSFVCAFAICSCLLKRLQEHYQSSAWHEEQSLWYWRYWRSHLLALFIANFYISQYLPFIRYWYQSQQLFYQILCFFPQQIY